MVYGDIHKFVCGCFACASRGGTSWRRCAPLQSIPVGGPFERVVSTSWKFHKQRDVIDYLTKWGEAYATGDLTSETIERLLVDNVVCVHIMIMEYIGSEPAVRSHL